ncbi:MAG: hypothetical protein H7246_06760 [Phycisphaerae bacterium]|nr:hypothetical protein [Saprospiraceae bacterium]
MTKSKIVFDLSLQTQFLSAKSNIYDVGLGAIGKRNKLLGMITFGYGRHDVHPFSLGLSEAVRRTHVDAFRLSGYMNFALSDDMFLIIRGSRYWGDGEHIRNGDPYNAPRFRKNFQSFAFEPALFISLGKSRHLFIGIGAHLVKEKSEFKVYDKLFDPWPIWLALGYQFGKKF